MRIILPSASIAAFTGTCLVSADKIGADHQVTHHHEQRLVLSQITRDVDESLKSSSTRKRSLNAECNTFNSGDDGAARNSENGFADVGILGCGPNQICEPNESSTLGGRCTMSSASAQMKLPGTPVTRAAFSNRHGRRTNQKQRALRFLQESDGTTTNTTSDYEEKVCPPNCPQQFCDCAHADGDAEKCASELHSVCINDLLSSCVPDSFITFYTDTYCPFASCIALEGKSYEECSCAYYQNYCDVYYAYMESIEKCAVANCCDGQPDGMKYSCIPGMEPTSNPTLAPIFSPHPSSSPTISSMPTVSSGPSASAVPTVTPTSSAKPTVSSVPTPLGSSSPSAQPSVSSSPSTSVPTASSAPSVSPVPTESPTVTAVPTVSSMPSAAPSEAPAGSEESSPTYVPTADGIEIVTTATDAPAAVPASDRSSGGMVHMTNFLLASLVAGAGGVMWLFA